MTQDREEIAQKLTKQPLHYTCKRTAAFVGPVTTVPVAVAATQAVNAGAVAFTLELEGPTHC